MQLIEILDPKIEFHLEKNNRNAITQSMDFLYIILYKSYPPEEQKMGWAAVLNHFTGWDYWGGI